MIAKQDLSNKVYTIAKKMVSLQEKNQEESNNFIKLSSKLNDLLAQCFEKNLDHEIEKAIQIAVSEKEIDVVNTLLNEVNVEIETLAFNDSEDNECESLMLLLPCIVIGKDMSKPFYSIQELENKIANKLLEKQVIKQRENFKLSSNITTFEDTKKMTLANWWNLHRSIITEDETSVTSILARKKNYYFSDASGIQGLMLKFIFMQPALDNEEEPEVNIDTFLSDELDDLWVEIANELTLENKYYNITFLSPNLLDQTTESAYRVFEDLEFSIFFNRYMSNPEVKLMYARTQDNPDNYVVMFVQDDAELLLNFYVYETYGNTLAFIESLIDKVVDIEKDNIYYIEDLISTEVLDQWSSSQWDADVSAMVKTAQEIDVKLSKQVSEPYFLNEKNPVYH
jgi:hypothetical protein